MNKKGIFFSLTVMFFIAFLVIFFNNKAEVREKENLFQTDRASIIVLDKFVRDFERRDIQKMLENSAESAMVERTKTITTLPISIIDISEIMKDGEFSLIFYLTPERTTDNQFDQLLGLLTLTFIDKEFTYQTVAVRQFSDDFIELDFSVNYKFSAFDNIWTMNNEVYTVKVPVFGLSHPNYVGDSVLPSIIDEDWTSSTSDCLANLIFSATVTCSNNWDPPV